MVKGLMFCGPSALPDEERPSGPSQVGRGVQGQCSVVVIMKSVIETYVNTDVILTESVYANMLNTEQQIMSPVRLLDHDAAPASRDNSQTWSLVPGQFHPTEL